MGAFGEGGSDLFDGLGLFEGDIIGNEGGLDELDFFEF